MKQRKQQLKAAASQSAANLSVIKQFKCFVLQTLMDEEQDPPPGSSS